MKSKTFLTLLTGVLIFVIFSMLKLFGEEKELPVSGAPLPKGDRILSIALAEDEISYEKALDIARAAGLEEVSLGLHWKQVETEPLKYDPSFLQFVNTFYPSRNIRVNLGIWLFDNIVKVIPDDLANLPLDDPRVIDRYKKMLDWVFVQIPDLDLHTFNVGSEFDAHLGNDPTLWRQYQRFYQAVAPYIREKRSGILVTAEATFNSLTRDAVEHLKKLHESSDVIAVSYYPVEANSHVKDPSIIRTDFDTITKLYPGKPIYFSQLGYPSSPLLKSSEKKQAKFIQETFQAWDLHASQVAIIEFTWLHDVTPAILEQFISLYGVDNPEFKAFLGTLGLRTADGKDKEAFQVLKAEAKARGW